MENKNETFNYTYSASQQEEIRRIAEKYKQPAKSEDTLEQLRELDKSVSKLGKVISLIVGIIGALVGRQSLCSVNYRRRCRNPRYYCRLSAL